MALSAIQKQKLEEIQAVLQQVEDLLVGPTDTGRNFLTVAGDVAGGWTVRAQVKDAVVKIAEVLAEG